MCKVLRTGEMVELPGEGERLQRLEGDFYKPIGKKLSLKFVNNGKLRPELEHYSE